MMDSRVVEESVVGMKDARLGPIRILLVEDNPEDARTLRELLAEESGFSFELREAGSMSAAEIFLAIEDFDVIVLDLFLPDSSGPESFRRAHVSAPGTPILVLTILEHDLFAASLLNEGAMGYFVKDAEGRERFVRSIQTVVDQARKRDLA